MKYLLVPKSTKLLVPGQFWAVPMSDGRFACGRVLQLGGQENPGPSRGFFGGLHRWVSATPPTAESTFGSDFIQYGTMHVWAITRTGGAVLGCRPLEADGIALPTLLSAQGGDDAMILLGTTHLRKARPGEWGKFPVLGHWGYGYIVDLANHHLITRVA